MSKGNSGHFEGTKGERFYREERRNQEQSDNKDKLGIKSEPNSVTKNYKHGRMIQERYYDENGDVYLDIDYTDHNNPKYHPIVPHQHNWYRNEEGKLKRRKYEKIKKRGNNSD